MFCNSKPKVSVIIPVYRVEKLLDRCLKSIVAQTYSDWECLLVDDGSPDNSGLICEDFSKQDSRFKTFHTENRGVSAARNYGIENATGEWVCFVDSDDWIDDQYLEHLVQGIRDEVNMVITNYASRRHIKCDSIRRFGEMIDYMIDSDIFAMSGPYAKLYENRILKMNLIRFPVGIHMGEDAIFNTTYMYYVSCACFMTCNDYHYDQRTSGSLSRRYYGLEKEYLCFKIWRDAELRLFEKFYLREDALKKVWKVRLSSQFKRVYQSVFKTDERKTPKKCIMELRGIEKEFLKEYARYGVETNLAGKLQKFLITHKFYLLLSIADLFIFRHYVNK